MKRVIEFGAEICVRNVRKDFFIVKGCERERFYVGNWEVNNLVRYRSKMEMF